MKAIIPAAGIGTRLRPYTYSVPKILLNVAGKPMISYIIDDLINTKKVDTIIIIVGHLKDLVEQYIDNKYKSNKDIKFILVSQEVMLGLGHAVYQTKEYIKNEPVIIVLGDTIFEFDMSEFLNQPYSAIGVKDVKDVSRFGIVEESNGIVSKLIEKPGPGVTSSKKAIAGMYYVNKSDELFNALEYVISNEIKTKNEYQLTDGLQRMVETGHKFVTYEIKNWFDCGKPETLLSTNHHLLKKHYSKPNTDKFLNTVIVPPAFIGENCNIENSVIGPYTTISENTVIRNSIIEGSIVGDNTVIDKAFLSNSIIGSYANVKGDHKQLYIGDSTEIKL